MSASAHIGQDAPREYGRAAHTKMGPAKRWQKRGRHPKVDGGRTSPCAGATPYVLAYRERGLDHGVGHFRPLSITRQRHLLAYHGIAMSCEGLCQVF